MSTEDATLSPAAAALARAAPREWDEFKKAVKTYEDARKDNMLTANPSDVHKYQGFALGVKVLRTIFDDCLNATDRMAERARIRK